MKAEKRTEIMKTLEFLKVAEPLTIGAAIKKLYQENFVYRNEASIINNDRTGNVNPPLKLLIAGSQNLPPTGKTLAA